MYAVFMEPFELKEVRKKLGLTQLQLAVLLKTPLNTYSSWERGIRRIPGILEVALKVVADLEEEGKE